jgi:hypothetical protein
MFKQNITLLTEIDFNNFINLLFATIHNSNFIPLLQKHDEGSDGLFVNEKISISIYGPNQKNDNLTKFKKKVQDDYSNYSKNWKSNYPNWAFAFNNELTAERVIELQSHQTNVILYGIIQILNLIEQLTYISQRNLADYLGIPMEYIRNDIIKQVIDDILKITGEKSTMNSSLPPDLFKKIKKNYSPSEFKDIVKEHQDSYSYIEQTMKIIGTYEDREVAAMKSKILYKFQNIKGETFKERFNLLYESICENSNDDIYHYAARVLLLYLFEACYLGDPP